MIKSSKRISILILLLMLVLGIGACDINKNQPLYIVQFESMYNEEIESQEIKHGYKITKPDEIIREGYKLEGWYTSTNFVADNKWSFIGYTVTSDMTLYANWTALPTPGLDYELIDGESAYEVFVGYAASPNLGKADIVIQSEYNGLPVTRIGTQGFTGYISITNITIPDSVLTIGEKAFESCEGLTSITLPSSVVSIESSAFRNCVNLTHVTLPSSVRSIGADVFRGCNNLESITIPDSVLSIESNAFADCKLTIYAETKTQPVEWNTNWNPNSCPVFWQCGLSTDKTYVVYFTTWKNRIYNPNNSTIKGPQRKGYNFMGWGGATPLYTSEDIESAPEDLRVGAIWEKNI